MISSKVGGIILKEWIQKLITDDVGNVLANEPLSKHTTWKIGGTTDAFIQPKDMNGLLKTIKLLHEYKIPWKVFGKGSNLLVLDQGFQGAIISLDKEFQEIHFENTYVHVGAGSSFIRLANLAAKHGLTGLEFAGGIPGTVGGAIYMNAGAHGSDISQVLSEADVLLENGSLIRWKLADFDFSYRRSRLHDKKGIVLSGVFSLKQGDRKKIAEDMARLKHHRRKTQPYHLPCAGSVFRNPEGDYAGRLIEQLGLKGFRIGGAQISTMHANFIVNVDQASAKDVLNLIEYVKEQVYDAYHIKLVPEVELVGKG